MPNTEEPNKKPEQDKPENPPNPKDAGGQGRTQPQKDKDMAENRRDAGSQKHGPERPKEEEKEDINDINDQEEKSHRKYEDPQRDQDQSSRRLNQPPQNPNVR